MKLRLALPQKVLPPVQWIISSLQPGMPSHPFSLRSRLSLSVCWGTQRQHCASHPPWRVRWQLPLHFSLPGLCLESGQPGMRRCSWPYSISTWTLAGLDSTISGMGCGMLSPSGPCGMGGRKIAETLTYWPVYPWEFRNIFIRAAGPSWSWFLGG